MARAPDPRVDPHPLGDVPRLLREGAAEYAARRFWHAHEAWESAWHALRSAADVEAAGYVRGMILITAAFENATRGKEAGFKRQFAEGLHQLALHRAAATRLGLLEPGLWEEALGRLYADACRRRDWSWWNEGTWQAPGLRLADVG